jgi:fatty acid desaturase
MQQLLAGALQALALWGVVVLWQHIGPIVGFPGLAVWMAVGYWLAHRFDREAEQRLIDGWKDAAKHTSRGDPAH